MTDNRTRRASVRWSPEQEAIGLPNVLSTIDPTWFANEVPRQDEGWSMICEFERTPAEQGNPSFAAVRYLVAEAPHAKLIVGTQLKLFERATSQFADLEIVE